MDRASLLQQARGLGGKIADARRSFVLRAIDRVGSGATITGRPFIANEGHIYVGDSFHMSSSPAQSHMVTTKGATIHVGDRVHISYGAAISAWREVTIGDDTRVGPFVVIMDSDFHIVGDRNAVAEPSPVHIGRGVEIGGRVTILPGSSIGDGARVRGGSVVSGEVPAGAVVGGVPARSLTKEAATDSRNIPDLVMKILGLAAPPKPSDGPDQIAQWDSLGSLKLLLGLEETFDVMLGEEDLKAARSVRRLAEIVSAAVRLKEGTA